jgi:hypothetical protein
VGVISKESLECWREKRSRCQQFAAQQHVCHWAKCVTCPLQQ